MKPHIRRDYPVLFEILTYMIEGQYLDEILPIYYQDFLDHYRTSYFDELPVDERTGKSARLRAELARILNDPTLDYEEIFTEGAMHGMRTREDTVKVFEIIWRSFFSDEDWRRK